MTDGRSSKKIEKHRQDKAINNSKEAGGEKGGTQLMVSEN